MIKTTSTITNNKQFLILFVH